MTVSLKPYSVMTDSGVEWLGEVPEHWEVRRLKTVADVLSGGTPNSTNERFWDGNIVWVTPTDLGLIQGRYIYDSARHLTQEGYQSCNATIGPEGSVVVSTRAPIGHLGILAVTACTNQGCRLLVPRASRFSEFLYHSLSVDRNSLIVLGHGSTFSELSRESLAGLHIVLPPPQKFQRLRASSTTRNSAFAVPFRPTRT